MHETATPIRPAKRKRRKAFLIFFLIVQALFILLVIVQVSGKTGPSHADLVSGCYHHNWYPLFKSQQDCVTHYGGALNGAGETGKAIGAGLIFGLWVGVDVILLAVYLVYRLSRRRAPVDSEH